MDTAALYRDFAIVMRFILRFIVIFFYENSHMLQVGVWYASCLVRSVRHIPVGHGRAVSSAVPLRRSRKQWSGHGRHQALPFYCMINSLKDLLSSYYNYCYCSTTGGQGRFLWTLFTMHKWMFICWYPLHILWLMTSSEKRRRRMLRQVWLQFVCPDQYFEVIYFFYCSRRRNGFVWAWEFRIRWLGMYTPVTLAISLLSSHVL